MSCDHQGVSTRDAERYQYRCRLCGVNVCTDCGSAEAHRDSPGSLCRRCAEKGGHRYAFRTEIDHDKLRALVGETLAARILTECSE